MAKVKKVQEEPEEVVEVKDVVASLSDADVARAVERYLGLHPKYIVWGGVDCKINWPMLAEDHVNFDALKPYKDLYGIV